MLFQNKLITTSNSEKFSCLQLLECMPLLFSYFEDRKCHTKLFLDLKGLVLGLSASSKSLCNVLKCKTSEKEKFHDIVLIITRDIYVFVRSGFFCGSQKKYACQGPIFSTRKAYRHCSLSTFTPFASIYHSLS